MNRIRKVKKNEFIFNLYSSDFKSFDINILFKKEIVKGIGSAKTLIFIFDIYDP